MEVRLHHRLQVQLGDRLRNPVGDRGDARVRTLAHPSSVSAPPLPAVACRHPRTSGSRACRGSLPGSSRTPQPTPHRLLEPLVGPYLLPGFPDHPLVNVKRLLDLQPWLGHRLLPLASWLTVNFAWMGRPLRSSPVTGPSSLLPGGPPLCLASGRGPLRFLPLGPSLGGPAGSS